LSRPTILLIDFVGTLVSFKPDHEAAVKRMFEELEPYLGDVNYSRFLSTYEGVYGKYLEIRRRKLIEIPSTVWVKETCSILKPELQLSETLIERAVKSYFSAFMKDLRPRPKARATLAYLHNERKYRISLISNFSYAPALKEGLRRVGLYDFFDELVISHEVGYRKPHPSIFEAALKALKGNPNDALMVGDTPQEDIYGAKRLGIRTCLVLPSLIDGYSVYEVAPEEAVLLQPDITIRSLAELRRVL